MLTLGTFFAALSDYQPTGREPAVSAVVIDSREVVPGSVFVAFDGERTDGHEYVAAALGAGAQLALVERPVADCPTVDLAHGEPPVAWPARPFCLLVEDTLNALQQVAAAYRQQFSVRVIGITGSVGKTTTKELTYTVLAQRFQTLKSEGNYNNEIGLPLTLLQLTAAHQRAVLEMGMYARGEIRLLCRLARPEIGVVTNIGPVHLERLGSMEAIVAAKQELVEALPESGIAILNRDDQRVMSLADHTPARIFTYGLDGRADIWADGIESMGLDGIRFNLHYGPDRLTVAAPLLGRHSVHTALRAAAVGLVEGLTWEQIVAGLQAQSAQLRLFTVPGPHGSTILDDSYNASPESVMAALNLLADLNGRRIAVLGDMLELGDVEERSHRLVGRRAAAVVHTLIAVGPRGRLIGDEALRGGMPAGRVLFAPDAEAATALLAERIEPGDMILVKGSLAMRLDRIVSALGPVD